MNIADKLAAVAAADSRAAEYGRWADHEQRRRREARRELARDLAENHRGRVVILDATRTTAALLSADSDGRDFKAEPLDLEVIAEAPAGIGPRFISDPCASEAPVDFDPKFGALYPHPAG